MTTFSTFRILEFDRAQTERGLLLAVDRGKDVGAAGRGADFGKHGLNFFGVRDKRIE
jgi:hypothetical protein